MRCFRYVDGQLCEEFGEPWGAATVYISKPWPMPPIADLLALQPTVYTRRERRQQARRGRRFPVRVPKRRHPEHDRWLKTDTVLLVGHRLRYQFPDNYEARLRRMPGMAPPSIDVLLYLPSG